ncbi:hypothetical protein NDU88_000463 [Pleurodeles waltl]|uniref:Uncharacterized protein n=1 Tax=Pleurodeles waltl TaxID=8319 RepID=A0AAV7THC2_PLEWA|nr:hypothetical protein NDU88_000463 [Pleurodeles waltl]
MESRQQPYLRVAGKWRLLHLHRHANRTPPSESHPVIRRGGVLLAVWCRRSCPHGSRPLPKDRRTRPGKCCFSRSGRTPQYESREVGVLLMSVALCAQNYPRGWLFMY